MLAEALMLLVGDAFVPVAELAVVHQLDGWLDFECVELEFVGFHQC